MKIDVKPEHEKFIRDQVRTGLYSDEADVVSEAIEAMKSHNDSLRLAIEEGRADYRAGRFETHDMKKTIEAARRRFKGGRVDADHSK